MNETTTDIQLIERELRSLATFIDDWRELEDITKAELLRRHPDLGSDKTYGKLITGDTDELNVPEWLDKYRGVWGVISGDTKTEAEELYEDFTMVKRARKLFIDTAATKSNARFGLFLGPSGSGKTSIKRVLERKYGSRIVSVEASEAWKGKDGRGSHLALMREIVKACGRRPHGRREALLSQCIECLDKSRVAVVVDEAYHLCPQGLDITKTLLNNSRGEFFFFSLAALWDDMTSEKAAYRAVKQLTTNRNAGVLRLKVYFEDVAILVERRLPVLGEELQKMLAAEIMEHASKNGNYAFAREVIGRVARRIGKGVKITRELIKSEVRHELMNRDERAAA